MKIGGELDKRLESTYNGKEGLAMFGLMKIDGYRPEDFDGKLVVYFLAEKQGDSFRTVKIGYSKKLSARYKPCEWKKVLTAWSLLGCIEVSSSAEESYIHKKLKDHLKLFSGRESFEWTPEVSKYVTRCITYNSYTGEKNNKIIFKKLVPGNKISHNKAINKMNKINEKAERLRSFMSDCPFVGANGWDIETNTILCQSMLHEMPSLNDKKVLVLFNPEVAEVIKSEYPTADMVFMQGSQSLKNTGYSNINLLLANPFNTSECLSKVTNMKFDVVIGNPPYQDPVAKSSKKLWPEFFKKSFELVKDKGYVSLITPNAWQTPSSDLFEYFQKYQCTTVCLDAREYFRGVGTSVTWYVIKKEEKKEATETKVVGSDNKINFRKLEFLPIDSNPLTFSIIEKLFSFPSLGIKCDSYCHSQRKERTNKTKNKDYLYPIKHGNSTVIYSNVPHPAQNNLKVAFHKSGKTINPFVDEGVFGLSEDMLYKTVNSSFEGKNLCTYLTSNVIKFLTRQTTYAMNMSKVIIKKIPTIDLSKEWTNKEIYEYFKLTPEEVEHIEKFFKPRATEVIRVGF